MKCEGHKADAANRRHGFGIRPVEPPIWYGKSFAHERSLTARARRINAACFQPETRRVSHGRPKELKLSRWFALLQDVGDGVSGPPIAGEGWRLRRALL